MNPRFGREAAVHRETMNLTCVISILKDGRATSGSPDVAFKDEGLAGDVQVAIKVWVW